MEKALNWFPKALEKLGREGWCGSGAGEIGKKPLLAINLSVGGVFMEGEPWIRWR